MKVFLLQDVKKLGKAGEIVEVSDGYAKNFILPKKLGKEATKEVMNEWNIKKGAEANRKEMERQAAIDLGKEIQGKSFTMKVKGGGQGRLFGSVTSKDVADALNEQLKINVDKKKVLMKDNIKAVGSYDVEIKLHPEVTAKVKINVEEL